MESSQSFSAPPHGISPAALAGVRVVEMGQLIAGPFCGKTLGEFGADVIKIEAPGTGDPLRNWRLILARQDIEGGARIQSVARSYGYGSPEALSRAISQAYGTSPLQLRKAGAGPGG